MLLWIWFGLAWLGWNAKTQDVQKQAARQQYEDVCTARRATMEREQLEKSLEDMREKCRATESELDKTRKQGQVEATATKANHASALEAIENELRAQTELAQHARCRDAELAKAQVRIASLLDEVGFYWSALHLFSTRWVSIGPHCISSR